jgi:hypothetical protein
MQHDESRCRTTRRNLTMARPPANGREPETTREPSSFCARSRRRARCLRTHGRGDGAPAASCRGAPKGGVFYQPDGRARSGDRRRRLGVGRVGQGALPAPLKRCKERREREMAYGYPVGDTYSRRDSLQETRPLPKGLTDTPFCRGAFREVDVPRVLESLGSEVQVGTVAQSSKQSHVSVRTPRSRCAP